MVSTMARLLDKDKSDSDEVKTTVRLTKGLLKQLKFIAMQKDITLAELMIKAFTDLVNKEMSKK